MTDAENFAVEIRAQVLWRLFPLMTARQAVDLARQQVIDVGRAG